MEQAEICKKVKDWLESERGYSAIITHKGILPVIIRDILPIRSDIEPDVIGVKDSTVTVVEAENKIDSENIFTVIGKCMTWKILANQVYLAFPTEINLRGKVFKDLEIGLLSVSEEKVHEIYNPPEVSFRIYIMDYEKQRHLHSLVRRMIETFKS